MNLLLKLFTLFPFVAPSMWDVFYKTSGDIPSMTLRTLHKYCT